MKYFSKLTLLALLIFSSVQFGHAQDQELSDYSKLTMEDYKNLKLPPLDMLFENAKNGPIYQQSQAQEDIERRMLSKEKRAFLAWFSIRGSYQYGMYGNDATNSSMYQPITYTYTSTAQNSYTVGAGINIPLDDLFDLGSRVKRQKLRVRSAEMDKLVKFEERKKEIIEQYSMALSQINIIKLRAETYLMANVQYEIAEKDFSFGVIESTTLTTEKERQSIALEQYEKTMFELTKSLMILELMTHTSILQNK